jgi:hypothetical protein
VTVIGAKTVIGLVATAAIAVGGVAAAISLASSSTTRGPTVVDNQQATASDVPQRKCNAPIADSTHWYVMAFECGDKITGVSGTTTVPQPSAQIDSCNGKQTNAQVTLQEKDGSARKAIEVSWVVLHEPPGAYLAVGRAIGENQDPWNDYPSESWMPLPDPPAAPNFPQPLKHPVKQALCS